LLSSSKHYIICICILCVCENTDIRSFRFF
jgi:hypothetical protein